MSISKLRTMLRLDAPTDGGGGGLSAAEFKALGEQMEKSISESRETAKKVAEVADELNTLKTDTDADLARLAKQAVEVRGHLARKYGDSGAADYLNDMQKFLCGVAASRMGFKMPEGDILGVPVKDVVGKAAADFTTTTDATAGYLIPDQLRPGIRELLDIYGNFLPRTTQVTAPAGHSLLMNRDAARPVAYWRSTQLSAMTEEATPMSFAQDTVTSILCGTYIQIANELLRSPFINFAAVSTVRLIAAILRKAEFGVIAGTEAGDEPSDGIIADATDQGSIASMTFANLITFLQSCIEDNEYAFNPSRNVIIMTPTDAMALAAQSVGATELTGMLVWGNPRTGVPTTIMGYELIVHPAANNGTNKHVLLGDPSTITLVNDGTFSVDISGEAGSAFTENASILRALNHYDWNIGQPSEWHKAVVTA